MEPASINKLDPNHIYSYRGAEFGDVYTYWYTDKAGNYWLYSNAPEEHQDHDPFLGPPLFNSEQPVPHLHPEFFSPEGYKMNRAVQEEFDFQFNTSFDPNDRMNCWYGSVTAEQGTAPVYLDKTIRENLYLFVQQQIRLVDAGIPRLRKFTATLFSTQNAHDKMVAAMLILMDQGFYTVKQLTAARVGDLVVRGESLILLGKKLTCDVEFLDFMLGLSKGRDVFAPLFAEPTFQDAEYPVSETHLYSILAYLNVSPKFLPYARASLVFSQIMHRNLEAGVDPEAAEALADKELAETLSSTLSARNYVNPQLRRTLVEKFTQSISKSFGITPGDSYGVIQIDSSHFEMSPQEVEYSQWLHSLPLHVLSAGELGL